MIETPTDILSHYADKEACDSFIAWRKKIRKPLTERAALMLARTLAEIRKAGGDATEALDTAQERGWMTIKAAWYFNSKDSENGNRHYSAGAGSANGDAATRQVVFAAIAERSPSENCF